jgi:uncharacterized RDD family membrane protein YckC
MTALTDDAGTAHFDRDTTNGTLALASASTSRSAAGLGRRAAARAVDAGLLAGAGLAVGGVTGFGVGWFAFQLLLVAAYLVGLDTRLGTTVGKALFGLRVVGGDGRDRRPTVAEAARREAFVLLGAVPFLGPVLGPVAWSVVAWSIHRDPRGQGIHDRFAGTQVTG